MGEGEREKGDKGAVERECDGTRAWWVRVTRAMR